MKLFLGSTSVSRKQLLTQMGIEFTVVHQSADESACDWTLSFVPLVMSIAQYKMNHVILPSGTKEGERCLVLTADTMSQDSDGIIHGKPLDKDDAIAKIRAARNGSYLCTAYCLDRRVWRDGTWHIDDRIHEHVDAQYEFNVPERWIETYLENSRSIHASGAITVEDFGMQFLRVINGSYSAIIGLPVFEVRESLEKLGFFSQQKRRVHLR